jgi:hypothetical protein
VKIRYKSHPEDVRELYQLNPHGFGEVLTGDDSAFFSDLECYLESSKEWKCLREAFKRKDVITDNYNLYFREAKTEEEKQKGYYE